MWHLVLIESKLTLAEALQIMVGMPKIPKFPLVFPGGSDSKESTCNAGDLGLNPGSVRSPGEGNSYPFQYSFLENSMDRGAWRATVHWIAKSQTNEVKVAQSCLTLCNPVGYTVHGFLQPRILEWVAFPFSRVSSKPRDWTQVSCIAGRFFSSWATRDAQEYCRG